jgi:hypothetical protein
MRYYFNIWLPGPMVPVLFVTYFYMLTNLSLPSLPMIPVLFVTYFDMLTNLSSFALLCLAFVCLVSCYFVVIVQFSTVFIWAMFLGFR